MTEPSEISNPVICEFEYRPNRLQTALLFALVCAGEAMFCYLALFLDQPVNVRGIQLTAEQARMVIGGFAFVGPIGVVALGSLLVSGIVHKRRIVLTHDSLILPKPSWHGLSTSEIEVPFTRIVGVIRFPMSGNALCLKLELESGAIAIPCNMFPQRPNFETLVVLLVDADKKAIEERDRNHAE